MLDQELRMGYHRIDEFEFIEDGILVIIKGNVRNLVMSSVVGGDIRNDVGGRIRDFKVPSDMLKSALRGLKGL